MVNVFDEDAIINRLGTDPPIDDNTIWLLQIPNTVSTPVFSYDWKDVAESKNWEELFYMGESFPWDWFQQVHYRIIPKFWKYREREHDPDRLFEKHDKQMKKLKEMTEYVKKLNKRLGGI